MPEITENLPAGTVIIADDEQWTAGAATDTSRWLHEGGERQVSDATVQRWFDRGDARVITS